MTHPASDTDGQRPKRGISRSAGRVLGCILDVRSRWWLSLWIWLPLAAVVYLATTSVVGAIEGVHMTGRTESAFIRERDLAQYGEALTDGDARVLSYQIALRFDASTHQLSARSKLSVAWSDQSPREISPELREAIAQIAESEILSMASSAESLKFEYIPNARQWLGTTWLEQVRSGEQSPTQRSAGLMSAVWIGVRTVRWVVWIGLAIAIVAWFLRGAQLAAYLRMRRRHEAGRCPRCDYDIASAPDHVCPECGCDHRAIRQEAIDALRRAKRWPLEEPLPRGRA